MTPSHFYPLNTCLTYPEKPCCGARCHASVLDFTLLGQVVCRVDWTLHPLDGEESGQVGGVRRDHDQGEKPPETGHNPRRYSSEKWRYLLGREVFVWVIKLSLWTFLCLKIATLNGKSTRSRRVLSDIDKTSLLFCPKLVHGIHISMIGKRWHMLRGRVHK